MLHRQVIVVVVVNICKFDFGVDTIIITFSNALVCLLTNRPIRKFISLLKNILSKIAKF